MIDTMQKYSSHIINTWNREEDRRMKDVPKVITLVSVRIPTGELKAGELKDIGEHYILACPKCGLIAYLDHTVEMLIDRISISPSVECPNPDCGFHEVITGWELRHAYKFTRKELKNGLEQK